MKRITQYSLITSLALTPLAIANPINGHYKEDSRCDQLVDQLFPRELGDAATFLPSDAFIYHDHRLNTGITIGVPDDGLANDWTVHITNVSGQAWRDLFFVADLGASIGNADGQVEDQSGAPNVFTDAFRIDAVGMNVNLMHESMHSDGILEIGEEWEFGVMNFGTGAQLMPPVIKTPAIFAGSSPIGPNGGVDSGNASILAVPVPEPSTVCVVLFGAGSLLLRRPRRM